MIGFRPLPVPATDLSYAYGPDSIARTGVRPGSITEIVLADSTIYPGTTRRIWIHVPADHDATVPARVTFCNDGWWYLDPAAAVRGGIVLDNLAASGDLPNMIGVFVDPGVLAGPEGPVKHRNAEYDAFDERYADFLTTEVLPLVAERFAVSAEPSDRAIVGGSSGGNAAVTAAWMRPERIGRVIAFNSSFAQMPGGNPYPRLLSETPRKPLRIFLHAAHRDLNWNAAEENWFAESLHVAAALAENGYDFRFVVGDGGHSPNHGGVLFPDALRWVWS
ncbi:alpha/beta hydrolase [Microbacterium gorillae]|uniref:alpha/beta hydrolase n=1 Tax=Microbacterium gorillae TaxID=1231063 RepID=UPI00058E5696|nr:alpha/beta hydrolase-fold protein [Microbacterium gorillae]